METKPSKKYYFVCNKPNCVNFDRPFSLTAEQLQVGEVIWCEYCDQVCVPFRPTDQTLAALGAPTLPGMEAIFNG